MGARKTYEAVTVYTLESGDVLGIMDMTEITSSAKAVNGKGWDTPYAFNQIGKRTTKWAFTLKQEGTNQRVTSLDTTVLTIGGAAFLADTKSFSVSISNSGKDGSGVADLDEFPTFVGTSVTVSLTLMVPVASTTCTMMTAAESDTLADRNIVVACTVGGIAFSAPMFLESVKHSVKDEDLQTFEVSLSLRGTPTGPTGQGLLAAALTGDALCTAVLKSGVGGYSATGLIESFDFKIEDGAIVTNSGTLWLQGKSGYAAEA